jgi:hypothetical protein
MTDFKVEFENRFYSTFLESSVVTPERIEVKVILYGTVYPIYKDKATGEWHNHIGKFELGLGLLTAMGQKLDEILK